MIRSLYFGDDKKYISAKEASLLTGYSQDYIGQLARGNKIDSKRVNRIWYVSEESILNYKNFSNKLWLVSEPETKLEPVPKPKEEIKKVSFFNTKKLSLLVFSFLLIGGGLSASNINFSDLLKNIASIPRNFLSATLINSLNPNTSTINISDLTSAYKNYVSPTVSNISFPRIRTKFF